MTILDGAGAEISSFGPKPKADPAKPTGAEELYPPVAPGLNCFVWDMRYQDGTIASTFFSRLRMCCLCQNVLIETIPAQWRETMTDKTGLAARNDAESGEEYAHGDSSVLTLNQHSSRTADKQADWFLPYLQPGMSLLDCGCATGSITVGLAKAIEPGQVIGIDISALEIERAQARAAKATISNIQFEVGNIYHLDFPDNSFDALFSHNVLEHIGEPGRALREMYRVLKPGGIIGIRDTDAGGVLLSPTDELLDRSLAIYYADWEGVNGHPRLGRHLGGLLLEAGFSSVKASASYEVYNNLEGRQFIAQLGHRFVETDYMARVVIRGLASADELAAMQEAWQVWTELPNGFCAVSHGEAVGWKKEKFAVNTDD